MPAVDMPLLVVVLSPAAPFALGPTLGFFSVMLLASMQVPLLVEVASQTIAEPVVLEAMVAPLLVNMPLPWPRLLSVSTKAASQVSLVVSVLQ